MTVKSKSRVAPMFLNPSLILHPNEYYGERVRPGRLKLKVRPDLIKTA
jgi:hypothetical protein